MTPTRSLAVLGATSFMARDFIEMFRNVANLHLFGRSGGARPYAEFSAGTYDAIINFVGAGAPNRIREMGADILSVSRRYDEMALDYQARHPGTRYVFLSSGAAYGCDFLAPVDAGNEMPIAANDPSHYYGAAKQEAEARHRALPGQAILDLRVFNYVSRKMDLSARFLLADMVRCVRDGSVFRTTNRTLVRDFLHPSDFAQMVKRCIGADTNMALDCYSQAPISKRELLSLMASRFGMKYEIAPAAAPVNITGEKPHYYSKSRRAADLGYAPVHSSQSAITTEVSAILSES